MKNMTTGQNSLKELPSLLTFFLPLSEQTPPPFVKGIWAVMAITWSKAHKWNGPNKVELMSRWEGEIYVC